MKRVIDFLFVVFAVLLSVLCLHTIYNDNDKIKDEVINEINENINKLGEFSRNININFNRSGYLKLNALYKGAHGESNPSEFNYNFKMNDGLFLIENEDGYVSFDFKTISQVINTFGYMKELAKELIIDENISENKITYKLDHYIINEIYSTDFKSISIEVNTKGFIRKIDDFKIRIDDNMISIKNKKIELKNKNNRVTISLGNKGYSLNINDKLKMNVVNYYQYNILINDTSLFLELTDTGFYLTALTPHAIYNALELTADYSELDLTFNKLSERKENPLVRYFDKVDFNIWS